MIDTHVLTQKHTHPRALLAVLGLSLLIITPCFWARRVYAGDFSSHVYNAWLAQLAASGALQGITVVQLWTNFVFDLLLGRLIAVLGLELAQRFALALLVLLFFWGLFTLVLLTADRNPWFLVPCFAVITYGCIFHAGFCNFYLSAALCLWATALFCTGRRVLRALAVIMLLIGFAAHAFAVAWTVCIGAYVLVIKYVPARFHVLALTITVMMLAAAGAAAPFHTHWAAEQIINMTGADQAWLWGPRYAVLAVALLAVWAGMLFRQKIVPLSVSLQICLLTAAAALFVPTRLDIPGFAHALVYVSDRFSLGVAVSMCVVLARARPSRFERAALVCIAAAFFSFLYVDYRHLDGIEDEFQRATRSVPAGSRVVSGIRGCEPATRFDPLAHMLDRACVGHCFSYANYEASTGQFRIRAKPGNPVVTSSYGVASAVQSEGYVVGPPEAPLYEVYVCSGRRGSLCVRKLNAGDRTSTGCFQTRADVGRNGQLKGSQMRAD